jgi:valyl-tRNA synthetase
MPFISEEIWQTLPHAGETIVTQSYPTPVSAWHDESAEKAFALLEQGVGLTRTARVLLSYPPGKNATCFIAHDDPARAVVLTTLQRDFAHLGRGQFALLPQPEWPATKLLRLTIDGLTVGIGVEGEVDLNKAVDRLGKQIAETDKETQRLAGKLTNEDFVSKAPPEVIADHQNRLQGLSRDRSLLASSEQQLRAMLGT